MNPRRLSLATLRAGSDLEAIPVALGPRLDPRRITIGIVHFGVGAFHRSHQAVFTEDAAAAGAEFGWGILGVSRRDRTAMSELAPQDCLYGVLTKDTGHSSLRIVGSIREVASLADSARVVDVISNAATHIVSLTITEKGYLRSPDGTIDLTASGVQRDLGLIEQELTGVHVPEASSTSIGLIVRGMARRYVVAGGPLTILSCDNISSNGRVIERVVTSLAGAVGRAVTEDQRSDWMRWLASEVAFPSTVVDRITPATTDSDRDEAVAILGLRDEALVVAEPYSRWIIEDRFAGPRPSWEAAGVLLTGDVEPFEQAKLRILNAAHSMFAYLGLLKGYPTIVQSISDEALLGAVRMTIDTDILPSVRAVPGLDLEAYRDEVFSRFSNSALSHATLQVARDGSQKIRERFVTTIESRLSAGAAPRGMALAIAAWAVFLAEAARPDGAPLEDPLAGRLASVIGPPGAIYAETFTVVARLLRMREIFGERISNSRSFANLVAEQVQEVRRLTGAGDEIQSSESS